MSLGFEKENLIHHVVSTGYLDRPESLAKTAVIAIEREA